MYFASKLKETRRCMDGGLLLNTRNSRSYRHCSYPGCRGVFFYPNGRCRKSNVLTYEHSTRKLAAKSLTAYWLHCFSFDGSRKHLLMMQCTKQRSLFLKCHRFRISWVLLPALEWIHSLVNPTDKIVPASLHRNQDQTVSRRWRKMQ